MKKFILETTIIVFLTLAIGLVYNQFSASGVSIFKTYTPAKEENRTDVYFQHVDAEFLKSLIQGDMAIVLDARQQAVYNEGHIPGAYSLSLFEFDQAFARLQGLLDSGKTIVTYCIDFDCEDSTFLATRLYEKGYTDILVYKGGFDDWQALGNPIATGDSPDMASAGGGY
jgi:rhodanese-related sulfurtransferase